MDTLLKTHNKLEFLHPIHGFSEKLSNSRSSKLRKEEVRYGLMRSDVKLSRSGVIKASSSALLELELETKESLEFELPLDDPSKGLVVDLAVVSGGTAGLAMAQQVSEAGLSVCSIDPSPKLIWPNNYGVWVDEFEAMDLLDCLDTTWSGAVVYIDEESKKDLNRPYGKVNRNRLSRKCCKNAYQMLLSFTKLLMLFTKRKNHCTCSHGVTIQASVVLNVGLIHYKSTFKWSTTCNRNVILENNVDCDLIS